MIATTSDRRSRWSYGRSINRSSTSGYPDSRVGWTVIKEAKVWYFILLVHLSRLSSYVTWNNRRRERQRMIVAPTHVAGCELHLESWSSWTRRVGHFFPDARLNCCPNGRWRPYFVSMLPGDVRTGGYRYFVPATYLSNDPTEKRGAGLQPCVAVPWNVTDHAGRTLERNHETSWGYWSVQPGGIVEETQDVPRGALARAHANMSMTLVRNTFKGKSYSSSYYSRPLWFKYVSCLCENIV